MRLLIIDAFTDRPFAGNPAGVCLLDAGGWPEDAWMLRVADELSLETAFARPLPTAGRPIGNCAGSLRRWRATCAATPPLPPPMLCAPVAPGR